MTTHGMSLLAALICASAVPSISYAQPISDAGEAKDAEMRAADLTGQALALQKTGKHAEAIAKFDAAWGVFHHVKILLFKITSMTALGDYSDARNLLRQISGHKDLAKHQARVDAMLLELDNILLPVAVTIRTEGLEGAWIDINKGTLTGQTPFKTQLEPGVYHLEISLDGYETDKRSLTIQVHKDQDLVVQLQRIKVTPAAVLEPPPAAAEPPPAAAEPPPVPPAVPVLRAQHSEPVRWHWPLVGAGAAAVAVGLAYLGKHFYDLSQLKGARPGFDADTQDPINLYAGIPLLAVGAGLIAGGVLLWPDEPQVAVVTQPGGAVLMLHTQF